MAIRAPTHILRIQLQDEPSIVREIELAPGAIVEIGSFSAGCVPLEESPVEVDVLFLPGRLCLGACNQRRQNTR